MKRYITIFIMVLVSGAFLPYCTQEPTSELKKAEEAIQEARDAGAPQYAETRYFEAERKFLAGQNLIKQKKYRMAKDSLIKSAELATFAIKEAKAVRRVAEDETVPMEKEEKQAEPEPEKTIEPQKTTGIGQQYTVVKGDCLWNIAKKLCDDPLQWKKIYELNKDRIEDPDLIFPGQVLEVPAF